MRLGRTEKMQNLLNSILWCSISVAYKNISPLRNLIMLFSYNQI